MSPQPVTASTGNGYWIVAGGGAVTPLGSSLPQTAASLVAGLRRFRRVALPDISAEPFTVSEVQGVTTGLSGAARLHAMLHSAIEEAVASLPEAGALQGEALMVLALPEQLSPAGCEHMAGLAAQSAQAHAGWAALRGSPCRTVQQGAAGGFAALDIAHREMARNPDLRIALLLGVDSYCEPTLLRQSAVGELLHQKGHEEGYVAAEAASAVLLARSATLPAGRYALMPPCVARAPAALWPADRPPDGSVLQGVLAGALKEAGLATGHISHWLSDADGSAWRSREEQSALGRLADSGPDGGLGGQTPELAIRLGQLGAAWGPLYWALTEILARYHVDRANSVLSWALDPAGHAGAAAMVRGA